MSLKNFIRDIQELKGGIGNISRRSFELKLSHFRSRSQSVAVVGTQSKDEALDQSYWVNIPTELLRDVIYRIESGDNSWPSRRNVVACAAVCSTWREITKELVKTVELSGKITFPISLKQPGPRDSVMQCYIKRDRTTSSYYLYLGLSPENGKFLLAARKFRRATSTDYIISLDAEDISRGSNTYVGKLRSNFLGTKFTVYDNQPLIDGAIVSVNCAHRHIGSKVASKIVTSSFNVAHIAYELNMMGARGPRRMQCTLNSVPATAVECGGTAPTPTEFMNASEASSPLVFSPKSTAAVVDDSMIGDELVIDSPSKESPLVLKNKSPRWHEQLQCWCLNFRGRVTVASVKNFQLVAAVNPTQNVSQNDQDKVLLQFGKIGKDIFTMDYCYPLSTFQAFAISLSSFDTKLACE